MVLLACEVASADALETYDGVCDLQVSFFLQVGQDSSSEEDFTLTHPEQVVIQFQSFDLNIDTVSRSRCLHYEAAWSFFFFAAPPSKKKTHHEF